MMNNKTGIGRATDSDPLETQEWIDSLMALCQTAGKKRAQFILQQLDETSRVNGISSVEQPFSAYRNTIPVSEQGAYPGDIDIETRLTAILRWNALAIVVRANEAFGGLGGHIASYASAAEIYETAFNHFIRARSDDFGGDLVYFQPHSAPGIYARAHLEGRLSRERLALFRQEVRGNGLCSYPHPWLMPDFWQLPTGSMGLGPLNAVYQARYMRYLQARGICNTEERHVWGFFGDGEMDEPESIAGLTLAARENLDNLTFIVNCNLQRLDGPVRGNSQIIQELESLFIGAGWNVIKVLWGSEWDDLFARDTDHVLLSRFAETVDGQYQKLGATDGDYNRAKFFDADKRTKALVSHMTDAEINALKRGGHDFRKLHAAFSAAKATKGRPTVILAKTKKGFGMGAAGESRMVAHQAKKLDAESLYAFRERFGLPISDKDVEELNLFIPESDSEEVAYLRERRTALGGSMPIRIPKAPASTVPAIPDLDSYAKFALEADGKEMSTTMAVARMMSGMLRDKKLGPRIVPIVADEARTFGMDNLFRQIGIYSPEGQLYEPEDAGSMLYYRESKDGQLLEEGITEAGALSSWTAAATSYSLHGMGMLPIYIFYSMFGFQRVGDLIWAAADQRSRGFLFGATAGRTTLSGEGLQHQDGTSQLIASTVPNCRSYDPAFAYELAVIMDHGMRRMMQDQIDEFYYITVMNENYPQPSMPQGAEDGILKGMYKFASRGEPSAKPRAQLMGSGTILMEVIAAANLLNEMFGIASDIYSVTSFVELARDGEETERQNRLRPAASRSKSHVETCLQGDGPVIAATDYVRGLALLISPFVSSRFVALGTDGFGRSDTRPRIRSFFEVDRHHIALAAIEALVRDGHEPPEIHTKALDILDIDTSVGAPWSR
ncbi:MAG: alpha-ketoglutarate dehydrogenase [Hyphomicrobiaceae bacterium]